MNIMFWNCLTDVDSGKCLVNIWKQLFFVSVSPVFCRIGGQLFRTFFRFERCKGAYILYISTNVFVIHGLWMSASIRLRTSPPKFVTWFCFASAVNGFFFSQPTSALFWLPTPWHHFGLRTYTIKEFSWVRRSSSESLCMCGNYARFRKFSTNRFLY